VRHRLPHRAIGLLFLSLIDDGLGVPPARFLSQA
jgi:hypothetical protein